MCLKLSRVPWIRKYFIRQKMIDKPYFDIKKYSSIDDGKI